MKSLYKVYDCPICSNEMEIMNYSIFHQYCHTCFVHFWMNSEKQWVLEFKRPSEWNMISQAHLSITGNNFEECVRKYKLRVFE